MDFLKLALNAKQKFVQSYYKHDTECLTVLLAGFNEKSEEKLTKI